MNKKSTRRDVRTAIAAVALAMAAPATAHAAQSHMIVGSKTTQPIGHYNYCRQNHNDCNWKSRDDTPVTLTRKRWAEMDQVNAYANRKVRPVTDLEYYGVEELWIMPVANGDCEDYVLLKRQMLINMGWPPSSLLITVVRQQNGDGHAVLTVRTDRADYILDNLEGKILSWEETQYTYLKRQSAHNSGKWNDIVDSRSLVGSVK